jgi:ribonucleoside-diphosphate reductase alpha chain
VLAEDGTPREFAVTDQALGLWRKTAGGAAGTPPGFVTAAELPVSAHIDMQSALQPFVDNSISKTINVPPDYPFSRFQHIYDMAYDRGLKGCTTFRADAAAGVLLRDQAVEAPHCCVPEREAD